MQKKMLFVQIIGLFLLALALPAAAETTMKVKDWDVTLGAQITVHTYYTMNEKDYPANTNNDDDGDFTVDSIDPSDSHFMATFENGPFKVYFDIREDAFKYAWAEWNFGSGTLTFGKNDPLTFQPVHLPPPLKSGIGQMIGPLPAAQVRLSVPAGPVILSAAAMEQPYHNSEYINVGSGTVEQDGELPILEGRVDVPIGPAIASIAGGYSSYAAVDADAKSYDIDSYMIGAVGRYMAESFTLHGTIFYDQNDYSHGGDPRQKGVMFFMPGELYFGAPTYDAESDSIKDSEYIGWAMSASYKFSDMFDVHIGVSGGNTEDDYGNKDEAMAYEIASIIRPNEYVSISPFFHITDWGEREPVGQAAIDEGTSTTIGVEWSLIF
ncbi:MAG: hypothetical protein PVI90_09050 [Desulfobacteraceae bacterium]|jgi:hypothetical protein